MGKRLSFFAGSAGAVFAAFALAGCAKAPRAERPDTDLPTVVSLNPCLDAILVEVASPEQILALSHYSRDPASSSIDADVAARFATTGGTAEEVLALQPDIVLASSFIDPATRSALERAGLQVETFGSPASAADSIAQIETLAQLVGSADGAKALIAEIEAPPLDRPAQQSSALLWQQGQIVAGESSLVAEHLGWAGLGNYGAAQGLQQADHVTLEQILADPPDILLVGGDSEGQTHPLLGQLRGTLIAPFAPDLTYCGGPTIPKARARLAEIRTEFETVMKRADLP